jgi:hypothetical protein
MVRAAGGCRGSGQPEAAGGQGSRRLPGVRAAGGYSRMSCQASVNGFLRNVAQKKFIE